MTDEALKYFGLKQNLIHIIQTNLCNSTMPMFSSSF